ncbi:MAG TPA: 3-deoxy-7-phosphoheptulonate synthase [Fimbriimonadaceae bacterium]|jgi:3-deoxy-7-phosphoheptulonate synthase
MRKPTDDLRILQTRPLVPPAILHEELPLSEASSDLISTTRDAIADIIHGRSERILAIIGPCSIHDPESAFQYAEQLRTLAEKVQDRILVVMRAYFEKPRTSVGWKGLINDPDLDESYQVNKGLRLGRKLLLDINALGMPTGSEFLDLQIPQHIADATSWVAIGARTTESQVHRELASGLSMPVGFKNTTEGSLIPAIDAVQAAGSQHWFPSVTKQAVSAIFQTTGNKDCHIILRGGSRTGPNYDEESVNRACSVLQKRGLPPKVMIDCSHGNSKKDYRLQGEVVRELCRQLKNGSNSIMGVMIESHLVEGRQDFKVGKELVFGQSVTDGCISIQETERLLLAIAAATG